MSQNLFLIIIAVLILVIFGLVGLMWYSNLQHPDENETTTTTTTTTEENQPAEEDQEESVPENQDLEAAEEPQQETPETLEETAEESSEETIDETANWKTYKNDEYNYSFKYPPEYNFGPCTIKPCAPFVDELGGKERVVLQGDISVKGWPNIEVVHYETSFYNPPAGTDIITWLKDNSPYPEYVPDTVNFELDGEEAVKVYIPGSPQAYSQNEICFIREGKLFEIMMTDVDPPEAEVFYDLFLSSFKFTP